MKKEMNRTNTVEPQGKQDAARPMVKAVIDRKVRDYDMSGYNHNFTPNQPKDGAMWAKESDVKPVSDRRGRK